MDSIHGHNDWMVLIHHALALTALMLLTSSACTTRYEYVSPICPSESQPRFTSAIAWQTTSESRTILGHVLNVADAAPLQGAQVRIRPDGRLRITNSLGLVRFDSVLAGTESLFVMAINHSAGSVVLSVVSDSGVAFLAAMESQPARTTDGCGLVLVQRKKPWWKVW